MITCVVCTIFILIKIKLNMIKLFALLYESQVWSYTVPPQPQLRRCEVLQSAWTVYIEVVSIDSHETLHVTFVPIVFLFTVMLTEDVSIGGSCGMSTCCVVKIEPVSHFMEQFLLYTFAMQSNLTVVVSLAGIVCRSGFWISSTDGVGSKRSHISQLFLTN